MRNFNEKLSEKEMFFFLLPLILSGTFQQIFSPFSTAIAARYLAEDSLAVVGALGACKSVEDALFVGMTTGFSFCVNRAAGHGDPRRHQEVLREAFRFAGLFLLLGVFLAAVPAPILYVSNVPEAIWGEARGYLAFLLLAGGFWGLENLLLCVIQGTGETTFPSAAVTGATVFQSAVLWLLLDRFHLGIEAVSLAILFYHLLLCVLLGGFLLTRSWGRGLFHLPKADAGKRRRGIRLELIKSGATKSSMMLMVSVGFFILQRRVNELPLEFLAGYAHASSLHAFFQQPLCAYAVAGGIISAQTVGGKRRDLFRGYNRRLLRYSGIWYLLFAVTVLPAAPVLIRMMAGPEAAEAVIASGALWLRVAVASYFCLSMLMIFRNGLQAMGRYRVLLGFGFLEMAVNLLWAFLFVPRWGITAFCLSTAFRWGVPALAALLVYGKAVRERGDGPDFQPVGEGNA